MIINGDIEWILNILPLYSKYNNAAKDDKWSYKIKQYYNFESLPKGIKKKLSWLEDLYSLVTQECENNSGFINDFHTALKVKFRAIIKEKFNKPIKEIIEH